MKKRKIQIGVDPTHPRRPVSIGMGDSVENDNAVVLGVSSWHQEYLLQSIALQLHRQEQNVIVITPQQGLLYEHACKAAGGQFIRLNHFSEQYINILDVQPGIHLEEKISDLQVAFRLLVPDVMKEEADFIIEALVRMYDRFGMLRAEAARDPSNMPVLADLYQELCAYGSGRLRMKLSPIVTGSLSYFNQQTNVELDNSFVVLDVCDQTKEVLPFGLFAALEYAVNTIKDRTAPTTIILDHADFLLSPNQISAIDSSVALYLLDVFKNIRAYNGAIIAASREPDEFFSRDGGRHAEGIANNCRHKVLLRCEETCIEMMKERFSLSAEETERLLRSSDEGLVISGAETRPFKFSAPKSVRGDILFGAGTIDYFEWFRTHGK